MKNYISNIVYACIALGLIFIFTFIFVLILTRLVFGTVVNL